MPYRMWQRLASWPVLSGLLGVVLLVAAALKGHEVATEVLAEDSLLTSRWFLMLVVEWEVFFALWLLGGFYRSYPRTTHWVALSYFCALFGVAVAAALAKRPSCGCFGKVNVHPWDAVVFDLAVVVILAVVIPVKPVPGESLNRHRWFGLFAVYFVFGLLSLITMGNYSMTGAIPQLRRDPRLNRRVTIKLTRPTTEEILAIGRSAAKVELAVDERLERSQPDYGSWDLKSARLWAVMELMVRQQAIPARWNRTKTGYAMIQAAPFGKSQSFWLSCGVLLGLSMMALRVRDASKGRREPCRGHTGAEATS